MTSMPSARLSVWYRISVALLYLATAGVAGPARFTPADATVASPSPEPCQSNELDVSSPLNPIATVYAPGQVGTKHATLHNPTPADFTDAYFILQLVPTMMSQTTAPPPEPTLSWSIDGSRWPGMNLSWTVPPAPQAHYWQTNDIALPTIAAGSTHTLSLQASFHTDSPTGTYWGTLAIYARSCGVGWLGWTADIYYTYYAAEGPTGCCIGNGAGSSSGNTGAGRPPSALPTARGSATPGVPSASPAATESLNAVTLATPSPSATPTSRRARNASAAGPPKTAWLGVLLVLAVATLIGLAGQVANTIRRHQPFK